MTLLRPRVWASHKCVWHRASLTALLRAPQSSVSRASLITLHERGRQSAEWMMEDWARQKEGILARQRREASSGTGPLVGGPFSLSSSSSAQRGRRKEDGVMTRWSQATGS